MAVTPNIQVHEPKTLIELIQKAEYTLSVFVRRVFADLNSVYITPGPFSIFRKKVFDDLGPYRKAHNTEDLEIALRMQERNYKIDNSHEALVYTTAPKTLRALYRQRVRWIYGFLRNISDYRQLFFNPSRGNLSFFILPVATLSIFSALYFFSVVIYEIISYVAEAIGRYMTVGMPFDSSAFDLFFLNTSSVSVLVLIITALTLAVILAGKYLTEKRVYLSRDIIYFVFAYGFIAPWWLAKSVYSAVFSREITWR